MEFSGEISRQGGICAHISVGRICICDLGSSASGAGMTNVEEAS